MPRFMVTSLEDALRDFPEIEELLDYEEYRPSWTGVLIDTKTNEVVYVDDEGDAPEDKFLHRDLKVFVKKLNEVADESS